MPDLKTELETKVVPKMNRYAGLSAAEFALIYLLDHPGSTISDLIDARPPDVLAASLSPAVSTLRQQKVVGVEAVASKRAHGRRTVNAYHVKNWYRASSPLKEKITEFFGEQVPEPAVPPERVQRTTVKPTVESPVKVVVKETFQTGKGWTIIPPAQPPKPAPPPQPREPGVRLIITTSTKTYGLSVVEAREVYEQLKPLFG